MTRQRISLVAAIAAVAAAMALSATSTAATAGHAMARAVTCTANFTATVRQGPDKGFSVHGTMLVNTSASGLLSGHITPTTGTPSSYVGQVTGPAISIALYLGDRKGLILGNGSILSPLSTKACAVGGGTFSGIRAGDFGDWELAPTSPGCLPGAIKDNQGACIPAYIRYSGGGVAPQLPFNPN